MFEGVNQMLQKTIKVDQPMYLYLVSDWHIGVSGCREDIIEDISHDIRQPFSRWVGLGDYIDGREPSHKFYDAEQAELTVGQQYDRFFDYIRPSKTNCLGMVLGNHEQGLIKRSTINPIRTFCADNQITYADNTLMLRFEGVGGESMSMIVNHGAGGGAKVGGNLNKAVEYGKTFNADIVALGHYHRLAHTEECRAYVDEEGRTRFKPMTVLLNGCTLEGYGDDVRGSYVEQKMLSPCALGYIKLAISPHLDRWVEMKVY